MKLSIPRPYFIEDAVRHQNKWCELSTIPSDFLLDGIFGNSPYLSRLLLNYPEIFAEFLSQGPDITQAKLFGGLAKRDTHDATPKTLMRDLRIAKDKLALLAAIADISGKWTLEQVTLALSQFAEQCLCITVEHLLNTAAKRGEITHASSVGSGIIVLGMGKLGGRELNYSSDIDLIILFEPGRLGYQGRHTEQYFMNKLAQDVVTIMQERTANGYVFRTDLRLRPDPASMPPAINIDAAQYYYEGVGQNWERAAMIKARPVAGDYEAAERFLKNLAPFMWRRNLDFAAINDIHSIKRQMDSRRGKTIHLLGHNIKLGIGGIREIEFYAQIHQLIWGGREPRLRSRATCDTLNQLTQFGLVEAANNDALQSAYRFLRQLEHRLQMVADEQTHSLPTTEDGLKHIACFMGYENETDFSTALMGHLQSVHHIFANSFRSAEALGDVGNLVFTGVSHDPETLDTLRQMGYAEPEKISEIVMGWHHGSSRATRTKRARELLTELMPTLLKRLAQTANPDTAFLHFHEFLHNMPSGIPLFSMFQANPQLLELIAMILGSAPSVADTLSRSPSLLDTVLYADFYNALPSPEHMHSQLADMLSVMEDIEERLDALTRFRNERQFQAAVHLLKHKITTQEASVFLSDLADVIVQATLEIIDADFTRTYGRIPGSEFAVIALGKLGSREMTFSSDIDLVFIYDVTDFEALSDGEKQYTASVYYSRFVQRLLSALTSLGREGKLYEVDTRLRPSGKQGLLASSTKALEHYFTELAWTFEYMAFTKARVIAGDKIITEQLNSFIVRQLTKPRDDQKLRHEVDDMRKRTAQEFATDNPWHIKYVRGGMMDLDFIAQYLALAHAYSLKNVTSGGASHWLLTLQQAGAIDSNVATELLQADRFLGQLFNVLRLCGGENFDENTALPGLKKLLCESLGLDNFEQLKKKLLEIEASVYRYYMSIVAIS